MVKMPKYNCLMANDAQVVTPALANEPSVSAKAAELSRSAPTQPPAGFAQPEAAPLGILRPQEPVFVDRRPAPAIVPPNEDVPQLSGVEPKTKERRDPNQPFNTDWASDSDTARDPSKPFVTAGADVSKLPPPTGKPISLRDAEPSVPRTPISLQRQGAPGYGYQTRYRRRQP